ncbi:hypothetical protein ABPG77_000373 [Micractinium sp. CCAP 211/92]
MKCDISQHHSQPAAVVFGQPAKRRRAGRQHRWQPCKGVEQEYLAGLVGLQQLVGDDGWEDNAAAGTAAAHDAAAVGDTDTIAAIVTGAAAGAVSIIRLSGANAVPLAQQVFQPGSGSRAGGKMWKPESHRVYYGRAVDAAGGTLDEVLLLAMLGPRSYTAEDVIEIHTHGGGISAQRVLQRCLEAGARLARQGEFTLRAFLNGRLDLSQAESVAQLIDARTVAAADSALAGLSGGLGREVQQMRQECVDLLVEMDARLDFDEDLPPLDVPDLVQRVARLSQRLERTLQTARQGQLLRAGLQVALVGRPNVGKSSLLNALSGTERAIVTDIAGTTRDIVEAGIVIGGVPITLLDTAGLRESGDLVEQIGVERSLAAARQADIVLMVVDGQSGWTDGDADIFQTVFGAGAARGERGLASDWGSGDEGSDGANSSNGSTAGGGGGRGGPPALLVLNKSDLAAQQAQQRDGAQGGGDGAAAAAAGVPAPAVAQFAAVVQTSAATKQGLEELRSAVLQLAGAPQLASGGVGWAVNERQAEALIRAQEALVRVQASITDELPLDFWTIDLRAATLALGEVSGDDVTEEVLDSIFSRFCIGK